MPTETAVQFEGQGRARAGTMNSSLINKDFDVYKRGGTIPKSMKRKQEALKRGAKALDGAVEPTSPLDAQ